MNIAMTRAIAAIIGLLWSMAITSIGVAAEKSQVFPDRVISVGGGLTEIVYALGAQERLVAVDITSRYPPQTAKVPKVGYMRMLSAEPILALKPDLILAVEDAGPPSTFDKLRAAGVKVVTVPNEPTPQGVLHKVEVVAHALGMIDRGNELKERLKSEFAAISSVIDQVHDHPRVLFILSIGNGSAPLAAGRNTSAAGIIALAGGRNAIDDFEGFKPLSPEAAVKAAPDVVLVSHRTLALLGGEDKLLARPELAATPAGRNSRLVAMDGLLLLGFGPRTPEAILQLASALHPGMGAAFKLAVK